MTDLELEGIDPAHLTRARVIAQAFARTADHHRKTALFAGLIALAACGLAFVSGRPAAKAVALGIAVLFAVFCYRSIKSAHAYIDAGSSPVLAAIAKAPHLIVSIASKPADKIVRIATAEGLLDVRIDEATPLEPLLSALAEHAPTAHIMRE